MKKPTQIIVRLICLTSGIVWIKFTKPEMNYKIYLGEDWEKTYDGATTYIYNHATPLVNTRFKIIGYLSLIMVQFSLSFR